MPPKRKRPEDGPPLQKPGLQGQAARRATRQTPVPPPPVPIFSAAPPPPQPAAQPPRAPQPPPQAPKAPPKMAPPVPPPKQLPVVPKTESAVPVPTPPMSVPVRPPPQQTPVPVPTIPKSPQQVQPPKRGRGRPPTAVKPPQVNIAALVSSPPKPALAGRPSLGQWARTESGPGGAQALAAAAAIKENVRPPDLVAPEIQYHVPQTHTPGRSSLVRPHGPSVQPPRLGKAPPVVTPVPPPKPPTLPQPERLPPRADRNIDKVVLGKLCFRTWYPSYYGKEVLGDVSGNAKGGSKEGSQEQGKGTSRKDRDQHMLERLYVCPCCFKYSKELVAWWGHVKACEQRAYVPGNRIYVHPRGSRKILVQQDVNKGPAPKKRRGDSGVRYVEALEQDEGEWSIWEVDGEEEGVSCPLLLGNSRHISLMPSQFFCQNLSLFAKLFLDNKSVFYDVTGFNYFLLVYTPPATFKTTTPGAPLQIIQPPPQVTGFFSKEKISWDNNNLACILVFPPWQRKGLGALLMGASYEISRREGVLGGPEKPISDLGKRGYRRFWAGEIARWLLGLDTEGPAALRQELVVDMGDCSRATWIAVEDCVATLRDMGVATDAGTGPGKPPEKPPREDDAAAAAAAAASAGVAGSPVAAEEEGVEAAAAAAAEKERPAVKMVPRVRVDKEAVRRYVGAHRINLERTCEAAGFVGGYAMKKEDGEGFEQQACE